MNPLTLRRYSYRLSAALGLAYGLYVVVTKAMPGGGRGPLGELGEFLLVLAAVTSLSIGLFADEAVRDRDPAMPAPGTPPTPVTQPTGDTR